MSPLYGMGFGLMFIAAIFAYGYSKGHHSYKPAVTLIETTLQNMKCHLTWGYVLKLEHGIVVCAKVKKR